MTFTEFQATGCDVADLRLDATIGPQLTHDAPVPEPITTRSPTDRSTLTKLMAYRLVVVEIRFARITRTYHE